MERELKYSITAYVPLNINNRMLREACNTAVVTFDRTNVSRIYKFYGDDEKSLRFIITRLLLKVIN